MLTAICGHAQDYVTSLEHWEVKNGLSHREVNCLLQDKKGYIWIGTRNGLNRFDGYNFRNYSVKTDKLPFENIEHMAQDGAGRLWLVSPEDVNSLCIFDPVTGSVTIPKQKENRKVDFLYNLPDGGVVFGFEHPNAWYAYSLQKGIYPIKLPLTTPYDMQAVTERSTIWVTQQKKYFFEYSLTGQLLHSWLLPDAAVNTISPYVPATGCYGRYDAAQKLTYISAEGTVSENTAYIPGHKHSKLDFIFNTGIDNIVWRQGRLYHPQLGMIHDFVPEGWDDLEGGIRSVIMTGPGVIWLGGSFGLYKLTIERSLFKRLLFDDRNAQNHFNSYRGIDVANNRLVAANDEVSLNSMPLNGGKKSDRLFDGLANHLSRFYAVKRLHNGDLLFAAHEKLFKQDAGSRQIKEFAGLSGEDCWNIYEWNHDSLLLGLDKGLAWKIKNNEKTIPFTGYNGFDALRYAMVSYISRNRDGDLWICSGKGLYLLDKTTLLITEHYSSRGLGLNNIPATAIAHLQEDDDGSIWLATNGGLVHWLKSSGKSTLYTRNNSLSNDNIYAVYQDHNDRLWLSSDYGIMSFSKKTGQVNTYLFRDGISDNEFNRISHFQDSDGNLYFGSLNGITCFNPNKMPFAAVRDTLQKPGYLAITSLQQIDENNRLVDKTAALLRTNTITMYGGRQLMIIDMSLLNFDAPEYTNYYWKIEGLNKDWNAQQDHILRISTLPYGDFMLKLKAVGANGRPAGNTWSIHLLVPAPWYRTTWFMCTGLLLFLLIIFLLLRRRTIIQNRQKVALEYTVQERTEQLQTVIKQKDTLMKEIHHRVKNNLQVISALQQLQSTRSKDPQIKQALEESQNRVLSIAFIHHNLYTHDDLTSVEMHSFTMELVTHIASVFNHEGRRIVIEQDIASISLDIDMALPLGLIINELLTNSFKYSFQQRDQGLIRISLKQEDPFTYQFVYTDDGPGLPEHIDIKKTKTLGLKLITQLSAQLDSSIEYYFDGGPVYRLRFRSDAGQES